MDEVKQELQLDGRGPEVETERRMPQYHVELADGTKRTFAGKAEMDGFLVTAAYEDIRRVYKGHELNVKKCAVVVLDR